MPWLLGLGLAAVALMFMAQKPTQVGSATGKAFTGGTVPVIAGQTWAIDLVFNGPTPSAADMQTLLNTIHTIYSGEGVVQSITVAPVSPPYITVVVKFNMSTNFDIGDPVPPINVTIKQATLLS